MRIVVDTNVFVSAAIEDQSLPAVAVHLLDQRGVLLKSLATERQLFEVPARPYLVPLISPVCHVWFKRLFAAAEVVQITEQIVACRDPTDDKFLELAVNGQADLIVSGDADLLALHPFRTIPIIPPAIFVEGAAR